VFQYIAVRGAGTIGPMRSLYRLEELQLLMLMMSNSSLNDVFAFLKLYQCPVLKRLFVEVCCTLLDFHLSILHMDKMYSLNAYYNLVLFVRVKLVRFLKKNLLQLPTCTLDQHVENYMEIPDEEPPREDLDKLMTIKIRNYKGHYNEIRLVQYLLAKATNLNSLTVIAPKENLEMEYSKDPSDRLRFLHMQLSLCPKASENAQIFFSECDIDGPQPSHAEAFFMF
jgi:FBD